MGGRCPRVIQSPAFAASWGGPSGGRTVLSDSWRVTAAPGCAQLCGWRLPSYRFSLRGLCVQLSRVLTLSDGLSTAHLFHPTPYAPLPLPFIGALSF